MLGLWPKKLEFQKYLKKKTNISLISFQQLDFEIDMIFEIWELIPEQKKDCQTKRAPIEFAKSWQKWHQYFSTLLKNLSSWGQYSGLEKEKQAVFRSLRGNKKKMMIKWWICEAEDNGVERKIIRWMSTRGKSMAVNNLKMRTTLENLLMSAGRMHTANQRTIIERIQGMKWFVELLHDELSNTTLGGIVKLDK